MKRVTMKKVNPQIIGLVAAGSIGAGIIASAFLLGIGNKKINVYKCSTDKDIEYIVRSGSEYIIVNPEWVGGRNSFLVSQENTYIPKNWLLLGIQIKTATNQGFELNAPELSSYIKNIKFSSSTLELEINYGEKGNKAWKTTCKPGGDIDKLRYSANNVPIEYLLKRSNVLPVFNPRLGQKEFTIELYNAIKDKKNSTYSVYQLLSSLPVNVITGDESLRMKEARKNLIESNSDEFAVWEYGNSYRYGWQYAAESNEANINAGNWCREQQYSNIAEYTAKAYKVIDSTPEVISSAGWVKQDYPDGRFSGYVNYTAECDGIKYTLRKEGTVDKTDENRLDQYRRN